jgi:hypothetical protein
MVPSNRREQVAKAAVIFILRSGFGAFEQKPAVRTQREPRVTQQLLFFNSYSLLMTLYHSLGDYLAISPARYAMVRSDQHLGLDDEGLFFLHYIVPPNGQLFSRTAWLRVTTLDVRLFLQGYPTPNVTVTQKAPEFSDGPSTYKRALAVHQPRAARHWRL